MTNKIISILIFFGFAMFIISTILVLININVETTNSSSEAEMSRNCGVECICFLAKLYDSNISTDQIRQISKKYLANNEINLPGLKKLCNKVGLGQWETVQMDLCDIDYVIKPFILHFKQDHFVLCTDVSDNLIQILDPTGGSTKIKTMPKSVFGKFFDGYSLIRVTESKERL